MTVLDYLNNCKTVASREYAAIMELCGIDLNVDRHIAISDFLEEVNGQGQDLYRLV